jgi:hypothetical protein
MAKARFKRILCKNRGSSRSLLLASSEWDRQNGRARPTFGWYSKMSAEESGTVTYRGPGGKEVEVTEVMTMRFKAPKKPFGSWPDAVFLGRLGKFVRSSTRSCRIEVMQDFNCNIPSYRTCVA